MFSIRKHICDQVEFSYYGRNMFNGRLYYHPSITLSYILDYSWDRPSKVKYHIIAHYKAFGRISMRKYLENSD